MHYEDKKIYVDKVTVAVDVGLAVSPDGVAAQMGIWHRIYGHERRPLRRDLIEMAR